MLDLFLIIGGCSAATLIENICYCCCKITYKSIYPVFSISFIITIFFFYIVNNFLDKIICELVAPLVICFLALMTFSKFVRDKKMSQINLAFHLIIYSLALNPYYNSIHYLIMSCFSTFVS